MSSYREDLQLALELADIADALAMGGFRNPDVRSHVKPGGGIVTEADERIETAVRHRLEKSRRSDAITGEEFGLTGDGSRLWTIDPIDGTAAFAQGLAQMWQILIALVDDGVPAVGVVSRPAIGRRWWAAAGDGAFLNGKPITVSSARELGRAALCEDFRVSVGRRLATNPLATLAARCGSVVPWVDGGEILAVAEGRADVYLNWWGKTGPDLYAPVCILREAGGLCTALDGVLDISAPIQLTTNGQLHASALAAIDAAAWESFARQGPSEDISAIFRARADQPGIAEALRAIEAPDVVDRLLEEWRAR